MVRKFIAAAALLASTAGMLAPSAALARDREHGGWQARNEHGRDQHGYGNRYRDYDRRNRHGSYYASNRHYVGNGYYARRHGSGYGYNQHREGEHDPYRGH
ncbi:MULTISPECIES: hypothetical protein [Sphingomonadaceae]|jgi:hypothetical protein|uniref:Uncharacterized protein n=1 Tax=Sphingobium fuliginis (strain ATCC 27551) TaxID=336203 RepID=A0A292Z9C6_SPHSA|nr:MULTISPECIES: hypothetical protein [Sphingomonadaceae]MDG5972985.1 hypothetical protein [Sphingomonas paucimobilis]GAY19531.1 hypothetical protein SFOMI_0050 [Sphingobium fuliginis]